MSYTIRNYGFFVILIFLMVHIINLIVIEFHSPKVDGLLFRSVSSYIFLGIDVISIISIVVLLYGLLTFSKGVVLGWIVYQAVAWHFQFAVIIVNSVMVKLRGYKNSYYFMGTLIPALHLCIWSLMLIHEFRYWLMLKEFAKLPEYLRTNVNLMELSHHRYETDRLRKRILTKRVVISYRFQI